MSTAVCAPPVRLHPRPRPAPDPRGTHAPSSPSPLLPSHLNPLAPAHPPRQLKDKWGFRMTARYDMYAKLLADYTAHGYQPQVVRDPSL